MFTQIMFEFMLIGLIGGLLGIFYRNCLKVEDYNALVNTLPDKLGFTS